MLPLVLASSSVLVFALSAGAWWRRIRRVAIPDDRLAFLGTWCLALVLGVASLAVPGTGWVSGVLGGLGAICAGVLLLAHSLGRQRAATAVGPGMEMPEFSAPDEQGVVFHSSSLVGSIALIKFFRGHW